MIYCCSRNENVSKLSVDQFLFSNNPIHFFEVLIGLESWNGILILTLAEDKRNWKGQALEAVNGHFCGLDGLIESVRLEQAIIQITSFHRRGDPPWYFVSCMGKKKR
ncbi:unnamed protein product [Caretta caretta]